MSNQTKKQAKDNTTRLQFASPSASIYNSDSTIIINLGPKKESKKDISSTIKLAQIILFTLHLYLWFVIFIGIYRIG